MGQELECTVRYQRRSLAGKAYLETDYILFRGPERFKVLFKDLTAVKAEGGTLHLDWHEGPAEFDLGKAAGKWVEKILHPPSRADKLGLKPGATVHLVGKFDPDFHSELESRSVEFAARPDLLFFAAGKASDLAKVSKLAAALAPRGALWVVYPKGVQTIREIEVLQAGRAAGLKDVKVASFSATHTALKFVAPAGK